MKNKTFVCNSRLYKRVTKSHALRILKEDKPFHPQIYLVPFLKGGYRMTMINFEAKFQEEYETYLYTYRDCLPWEEILEKAFNSVYNECCYWLESYNVDSIGFYLNYDWSDL